MKLNALLTMLLFSFAASAQQVDIKGVDGATEGSTTIEIKKGTKDTLTNAKWETNDGTADIEGESAATSKEAKAAWKKACADWKKEIKEDNKDGKVISLNCGSAKCGGDAGNKVCTSSATYKIKSKVE